MTLTNEQRVQLERLRRKYRIDFAGRLSSNKWPEVHRAKFFAIQMLGERKYNTYGSNTNPAAEAWKLDVKLSAGRLAESAARCVRRNESTWRFGCEPLVFARLIAEVAWYVLHIQIFFFFLFFLLGG
jgi:hypothetical protein